MIVTTGALLFTLFLSRVAAEPSLELNLSVSPEVLNVNALTVKTTLKNTGDMALKLFNDPRSILSNDKSTVFDISSKSCKPDFIGISIIYDILEAVKSSDPSDFTNLAPGKEVTFTHKLADTLDFSRCDKGPYNIEAFTTFYHYDKVGGLNKIKATTNSRQFKLLSTGKPTSPGRSGHKRNFSKRDIHFYQCVDDQQFQITESAIIADAMVEYVNKFLAAYPSVMDSAKSRYTTWFGEFDQSRHNTLKSHFNNIGKKATRFTYNCGECMSRFGSRYYWMDAYVETHRNAPRIIYLCKKFWKAPTQAPGSRAGVMIRALSQFPENGWTTDYYITLPEVKELASTNPEIAVLNAETHRRFAETYFDTLGRKLSLGGNERWDLDGSEEESPDRGEPRGASSAPASPLVSLKGKAHATSEEKGKKKVEGSM